MKEEMNFEHFKKDCLQILVTQIRCINGGVDNRERYLPLCSLPLHEKAMLCSRNKYCFVGVKIWYPIQLGITFILPRNSALYDDPVCRPTNSRSLL